MSAPPRQAAPRQPRIAGNRLALVAGDLAAILLAVVLALGIWVIVDGRGLGLPFILKHLYWFPILAGLWLALAHANDFYNRRFSARLDASLLRLGQVTLQLVIVYLVIFFLSPRDALPRLFILYYAALSFLLIAAWRAVGPPTLRRTGAARRALVVGNGPAARTLIETLRAEAPGDYALAGVIVEPGTSLAPDFPLAPVIGSASDLPKIAGREQITEIILAQEGDLSAALFRALMDCTERGYRVVPMPLLYEQITGRVPVEHVDQRTWTAMLPVETNALFDPYPAVKRFIDVTLALIGLALFLPALPAIALAIRLDSAGPVFFRQARIGQGGQVFQIVKLRSMIHHAEQITGPTWAADSDPRITRVGRFLRKTRLDELPQLVNVLRGEMSLIGPRPERPEFVTRLSESLPFYRARHAVKPGITGWAQVRYPYGNSEQDALIKLQYDLFYIRHRSLALDLLILLRTLGKMISMQGT